MSDAAEIATFGSGWFGQGDAFWRWVKTPKAKLYLEAFDLLGDGEEGPDLLDPAHLERLAADIEARFGGAG